jgi:hypothetical protein
MSMKNSNDTIGNRTHKLPAFSAVPQPTAPPHAPSEKHVLVMNYQLIEGENLQHQYFSRHLQDSLCLYLVHTGNKSNYTSSIYIQYFPKLKSSPKDYPDKGFY